MTRPEQPRNKATKHLTADFADGRGFRLPQKERQLPARRADWEIGVPNAGNSQPFQLPGRE